MPYRKWSLCEGEGQTAGELKSWLAGQGYTADILSRVLAGRGIENTQQAEALLFGTNALPDPFLMKDMDKAVQCIHAAIENETPIAVFGDYDVDGITATALMFTYLESQGADVYYKLPSRSDDDYGLSETLVDQMADKGISLIVTVDNGTTAFEAAKRAKERGVALVVTDHHLPYDTLPEVEALVNPCRKDDESGLASLSGAGVAFMMLAALEGCPPEEMLQFFGDFAAIGTVADVMKLTGPNRTIVKAGLSALRETERPGLAALIEACGLEGKAIGAENISYGLAPRLNAAGRMDDATNALELLLADTDEEAQPLVENLQQQNAARQKMEQEILAIIDTQLKEDPELLKSRVLVLWGSGWHQGVMGIVASRLVDKYSKPAMVITFDGQEGRGSGRSAAGFSLHNAIASCEDILLRYGGHDLAAGFSLKKEHAEEFRRRVNEWAMENDPVADVPELYADAEVDFTKLCVEEISALDLLAPFGSGNHAPKFLAKKAVLDAVYPVSDGKHCRLKLRQGNSSVFAVLFGTSPEHLPYKTGDAVDALLSFSVYEGKQGAQVSGRIIELRPAGLQNSHVMQTALFESVHAGLAPSAEQCVQLAPTRDDTAAVYRLLKGGTPFYYNDLRPVFSRMGEEMTGRVLSSVAALEELGLIEKDEATARYMPVQVEGKRDLASSTLLQRLAFSG